MTRDELIRRIKETAYLEGDFTLRSGKKSKYYLDKYLFETCPDILKALGEEFAKHLTDDITLIAGAELGGVALAAAVAGLEYERLHGEPNDLGAALGNVASLLVTLGQVPEAKRILTELEALLEEHPELVNMAKKTVQLRAKLDSMS